jgi:hypothetical protein
LGQFFYKITIIDNHNAAISLSYAVLVSDNMKKSGLKNAAEEKKLIKVA